MTQRGLTAFLHTRNCTVLAAVVVTAMTYIAYRSGAVVPIAGSRGLALPSANEWLAEGEVSLWLNLAVNAAIAGMATSLNKAFNIMRSLTGLWGTLFIVFQGALPLVTGQFYGGTLMCVAMLLVMAVMYSCYGDTGRRKRVFLVFLLMSAGTLIQYAYMFYLPVMFAGLAQMRIMDGRSVTAALLGLATLPWILFGCGVLSLGDVRWPEFVGTFSMLDVSDMVMVFVTVGLTALLGIIFLCGNVIKLLSYNARNRANNGFLALLMITTVVLILVDYGNLSIYLPLLSLTSAYQAAHFFSSRRHKSSYIPILLIIALYITLYVLNVIF